LGGKLFCPSTFFNTQSKGKSGNQVNDDESKQSLYMHTLPEKYLVDLEHCFVSWGSLLFRFMWSSVSPGKASLFPKKTVSLLVMASML
jgi:hypothetical protein